MSTVVKQEMPSPSPSTATASNTDQADTLYPALFVNSKKGLHPIVLYRFVNENHEEVCYSFNRIRSVLGGMECKCTYCTAYVKVVNNHFNKNPTIGHMCKPRLFETDKAQREAYSVPQLWRNNSETLKRRHSLRNIEAVSTRAKNEHDAVNNQSQCNQSNDERIGGTSPGPVKRRRIQESETAAGINIDSGAQVPTPPINTPANGVHSEVPSAMRSTPSVNSSTIKREENYVLTKAPELRKREYDTAAGINIDSAQDSTPQINTPPAMRSTPPVDISLIKREENNVPPNAPELLPIPPTAGADQQSSATLQAVQTEGSSGSTEPLHSKAYHAAGSLKQAINERKALYLTLENLDEINEVNRQVMTLVSAKQKLIHAIEEVNKAMHDVNKKK